MAPILSFIERHQPVFSSTPNSCNDVTGLPIASIAVNRDSVISPFVKVTTFHSLIGNVAPSVGTIPPTAITIPCVDQDECINRDSGVYVVESSVSTGESLYLCAKSDSDENSEKNIICYASISRIEDDGRESKTLDKISEEGNQSLLGTLPTLRENDVSYINSEDEIIVTDPCSLPRTLGCYQLPSNQTTTASYTNSSSSSLKPVKRQLSFNSIRKKGLRRSQTTKARSSDIGSKNVARTLSILSTEHMTSSSLKSRSAENTLSHSAVTQIQFSSRTAENTLSRSHTHSARSENPFGSYRLHKPSHIRENSVPLKPRDLNKVKESQTSMKDSTKETHKEKTKRSKSIRRALSLSSTINLSSMVMKN